MLKDYIQRLQEENSKKIETFEKEMNELMDDLSCYEKKLDRLEQEKLLDTNIFSPRTIDTQVNDRIESTQKDIRSLKQKIEYVSQRLEECISNRNEYNQLSEELEKSISQNVKEQFDYPADRQSIEQSDNQLDIHTDHQLNHLSDDQSNKPSDRQSDDQSDKQSDQQSGMDNCILINRKEFESLLKCIYSKAEHSLTLLNGNKNRCRSEIQSVLKLIREYQSKFL